MESGAVPGNYTDEQELLGEPWGQFSYHANEWAPTPDMWDGDSLLTFMIAVERRLRRRTEVNTLVITDELWRRLREHLLADIEERAGFMLAKTAGPRLVVRDVVLIPDEDLDREIDSVSVSLPALIDVMNRAVREDLVLVEAHSHPLAPGAVAFSPIDDQGQAEMVDYLSDVMPGRRRTGLSSSATVRCTAGCGRDTAPGPLDRMLVTGDVLDRWRGDGRPWGSSSDASSRPPARYGPSSPGVSARKATSGLPARGL